MSFLMCTSQQAIAKAGPNADADLTISGQVMNNWSKEAEGTIAMKMRRDVSAQWTSLDAPIKIAIGDAVSDDIAIKIIQANPEGYTGLNEASTMIDVLKDHKDNIVKDLIKIENQKLNK